MIIWVNGTFGVGKTSTAAELMRLWDVDRRAGGPTGDLAGPAGRLADLRADAVVGGSPARVRLFDPETVGNLLMSQLADQEFGDFQELASWRTLVPRVADEIIQLTGQDLIAVQTVLREDYWRELIEGFTRHGHQVFHVVLDADAEMLHARIDNDENGIENRGWRHDHVDRYLRARPWLVDSADLVVDTTTAGPSEVAAQVVLAMETLRQPTS